MRRAGWLILPLWLALGPALADSAANRAELLEARRARLAAKWEAQFRAADADGDRALTREECRAGGLPATIAERFAEIDADADGTLSPAELQAMQSRRVEAQRAPAALPEDSAASR